MFQANFVEKIKSHILPSTTFLLNSSVYEAIWKMFCTAGRNTDDNTIGRTRFAYWIKWTQTHTHTHTPRIRNTQYLWLFKGKYGYVNTLQY